MQPLVEENVKIVDIIACSKNKFARVHSIIFILPCSQLLSKFFTSEEIAFRFCKVQILCVIIVV